MNFHSAPARPAEPAFNAPGAVLVMIGLFVAVHILRATLPDSADVEVLLNFAFIPARYGGTEVTGPFPGGLAADAWTFLSYAFLHGGLGHLVINSVWFLVFGSPVAWRFGAGRFLLFCAVTAVAGAVAHLAAHWGQFSPVIGASAMVSGVTAAAIRFVFTGAGFASFGFGGPAFHRPALPLLVALRNRSVLAFVVIWFVLNLAFGVTGGDVAWQAHVGGFLAGLLLFPLFDPPRRGGPLRAA